MQQDKICFRVLENVTGVVSVCDFYDFFVGPGEEDFRHDIFVNVFIVI
jgi:hypothetical protein